MALLKKIKSSTLVETIIATIILIIVFTMAMLILNNVFKNSVLTNEAIIRNRIQKVHYQFDNGVLDLPYREKFETWEISVDDVVHDGYVWVEIFAKNQGNNKEIIEKISCIEKR